MVPNATHGCGFRGLLRYLLLEPHSERPRPGAEVLGGTLAGRNVAELLGEFALVRRLRPKASKVVIHHSLSYASEEAPDDAQIQRDVARYLEHLGLLNHPHVIVRHADKDHAHAHVVISKIGFDRAWWDARLDAPRAQIAAALVEREFGLVEVERSRMKNRIDAAWRRLGKEPLGGVLATPGNMRLPSPEEVLPAPPVPAPKVPTVRPKTSADEDGILQQIRVRMEAVPEGLQLPEWVHALMVEGLQIRPSMKGEKISGWWVQIAGSDSAPVKLSSVDRAGKGPRPALGWVAMQKEGRVQYDPVLHNAFARRLAEVPFDKPVAFTVEESPLVDDSYPRDAVSLRWDWQPEEPLPGVERPSLVGVVVDEGPGARTPSPGSLSHAPSVRRGQEAAPSRPRLGAGRSSRADVAARVRTPVAGVPDLPGAGEPARAPGSGMHLGGGLAVGGPHPGAASHPGQSSGRPGPVSGGRHPGSAPPGSAGHPDAHRGSSRRVPPSAGRGAGGSLGSRGHGVRLDRGDLEALRHEKALEAASRVLHDSRPKPAERAFPARRRFLRSHVVTFSPEAVEAIQVHVNAFFAGEFGRIHAATNPETELPTAQPKIDLVLEGMGEVDFVTTEEAQRRRLEEEKPSQPSPATPPPVPKKPRGPGFGR